MTLVRAAAAALAALLSLAPVSAKAIVYSVDIDFVGDVAAPGVTGNVSGTFEYLGSGSFGTINLLVAGTGLTSTNGAPVDGLYDTVQASSDAFFLVALQSSLGPDFTSDPQLAMEFSPNLDSGSSVIGLRFVTINRCTNQNTLCSSFSGTLVRDRFDAPLPTITALSLPPTMLLLATGLVAYAASRRRMA